MCNLEVLGLNKEVKFAVYITPKTPGIWSLVINVIKCQIFEGKISVG